MPIIDYHCHLPPDQIAEVSRLLRSPFRNTFGSTETGLAPASKGLFPVGVAPSRLAKTQSSLCAVKLVDSDGNEVPDGDPGEVAIKGPSLFSGYVDRQGIDTSMFSDGWFRMGDMMTRTPDGLLDYVDRKKYLIKSGGENIYPTDVERMLERRRDAGCAHKGRQVAADDDQGAVAAARF